jgi:asparagine synthase (glutamine-hydrolysing)
MAPAHTPTDPALLLALFRQYADFSFLKDVDGLYAAVIYDTNSQHIHLVSDRYGLRHLYWMEHNGSLVWSSELKALLALPDFTPRIDAEAVQEFFGFGYLLEDRTWWHNVELLPSGMVITWSVPEHKVVGRHRYWWWDDIKRFSHMVGLDEAAEEMGRLFIEAVQRRCRPGERTGLMLSGGLDSRAVLAALPDTGLPIHTVTFGKANCDEFRVAAQAARVKGVAHHTVEMHSRNWLEPRIKGVWLTDGQCNILDMHAMAIYHTIRDYFDLHIHAFAGDLILGGSYLTPALFNRAPADVASLLHQSMKKRSPLCQDDFVFERLKAILPAYPYTDAFIIHNRVRRYTVNGALLIEGRTVDRKPTLDNKLMEFCYALPDESRYAALVYKKMLLRYFPELYRTIPWQKTGLPITAHPRREKAKALMMRVWHRGRRELAQRGIHLPDHHSYMDYDTWTRHEPGYSVIRGALLNPGARWRAYLPVEAGIGLVQNHLNGTRLNAMNVLLLLTFESYLQQTEC